MSVIGCRHCESIRIAQSPVLSYTPLKKKTFHLSPTENGICNIIYWGSVFINDRYLKSRGIFLCVYVVNVNRP